MPPTLHVKDDVGVHLGTAVVIADGQRSQAGQDVQRGERGGRGADTRCRRCHLIPHLGEQLRLQLHDALLRTQITRLYLSSSEMNRSAPASVCLRT